MFVQRRVCTGSSRRQKMGFFSCVPAARAKPVAKAPPPKRPPLTAGLVHSKSCEALIVNTDRSDASAQENRLRPSPEPQRRSHGLSPATPKKYSGISHGPVALDVGNRYAVHAGRRTTDEDLRQAQAERIRKRKILADERAKMGTERKSMSGAASQHAEVAATKPTSPVPTLNMGFTRSLSDRARGFDD